MKLGVQVKLILSKTSKMRAQYAGFVGRRSRPVVPYGRIFTKRHADSDNLYHIESAGGNGLFGSGYLLRKILHMLAHQIVARWMEQDRETPGVAKCDKMCFSGEEIYIENCKGGYVLTSGVRLVYALAQYRM